MVGYGGVWVLHRTKFGWETMKKKKEKKKKKKKKKKEEEMMAINYWDDNHMWTQINARSRYHVHFIVIVIHEAQGQGRHWGQSRGGGRGSVGSSNHRGRARGSCKVGRHRS